MGAFTGSTAYGMLSRNSAARCNGRNPQCYK